MDTTYLSKKPKSCLNNKIEMFTKHYHKWKHTKKRKEIYKEQAIDLKYNTHSNTSRDKSKPVKMLKKLTYKSTISQLVWIWFNNCET